MPDEAVAEVVVEVSVGGYQPDRCQLLTLNIVGNGLLLLRIEGTAVDDDGLIRLVAHHVAVLLQHIADECLYLNHSGK